MLLVRISAIIAGVIILHPLAEQNMTQVFISYRRADTADMSRRIYDELVKHLGEKHVFRDVDSLLKGQDFRAGIERYIVASDVMLVLIGDK